MANLTFRSIMASGSKALGEGTGPGGADRFDLILPEDPNDPKKGFDLSGFVDGAALLFLMTQGNNAKLNFITLNAPTSVSGQSYQDAKDEAYFVDRIIENDSDIWNLQIVRVPSGRLTVADNKLGIHSRNTNGEVAGDRDNFSVARIFLIYFGSE
jgi:hypothetical protein